MAKKKKFTDEELRDSKVSSKEFDKVINTALKFPYEEHKKKSVTDVSPKESIKKD